MKCVNCFNDAQYTVADPGVNPVNYCRVCLPSWLHERADLGHFPLVEPVVEAPVVEEPVEEAPAKKKKVVVVDTPDNLDSSGNPVSSDENN